jgi:hypothetical protein
MNQTIRTANHTFRVERDLQDVTRISRPDLAWRFVDAHGHLHLWFRDSDWLLPPEPAPRHVMVNRFDWYNPSQHYHLDTLVVVSEEPVIDEDGEEWTPSHYECMCSQDTRPTPPSN